MTESVTPGWRCFVKRFRHPSESEQASVLTLCNVTFSGVDLACWKHTGTASDGLHSQTGHPPQHQDQYWLFISCSIQNSKKPGGHYWWPTDLHGPHRLCLQVVPLCAIQHPQNQAVLNPVCHAAAGANLGEFPLWLLQRPARLLE